jgi:hypothetical protein
MERVYASVSDITALGIQLTAQQSEAAASLLVTASAKLRTIAKEHNVDIDQRISADEDYGEVVKNIVIQSVVRAISSISSESPAISQGSETNGQYSVSMTYLNAGQSLYYLRNELKELGILRQRYGFIEFGDTGE